MPQRCWRRADLHQSGSHQSYHCFRNLEDVKEDEPPNVNEEENIENDHVDKDVDTTLASTRDSSDGTPVIPLEVKLPELINMQGRQRNIHIIE